MNTRCLDGEDAKVLYRGSRKGNLVGVIISIDAISCIYVKYIQA